MTMLSVDTKVALLLCGHFSPKESASPLELREYNRLTDALRAVGLGGEDLLKEDVPLDWRAAGLERDRVQRLLERGAAMALAVERWTNSGLWILSRPDAAYPDRLRTHLGRSAPVLLFGVGDPDALDRGGLAIVGARDVDDDGAAFTADVARQCAREGIAVVSGGARGVDEIALAGAFEEGGRVVAVLPEGLGKASVAAKYRAGIREERLVLVSPYAPHAPFTVGNAMGRNRLIYAFADAALVVSAALRSGGTWAGAEEELKRTESRPVFVRSTQPMIEGNEALLSLGAARFPDRPWAHGIRTLIDKAVSKSAFHLPTLRVADAPHVDATIAESKPTTTPTYDAILPLLLELLVQPRIASAVAEALGVQPAEAKRWLDRAVKEGHIVKSGRPAEFRVAANVPRQPSLFER
jgi:predicted Rossmann fold nucleotide-binding protein DprA/Smf involved in DNA uptake